MQTTQICVTGPQCVKHELLNRLWLILAVNVLKKEHAANIRSVPVLRWELEKQLLQDDPTERAAPCN
jgi:hypothetical protein